MANTPSDRDTLVSQFCEITGASSQEAEEYLTLSQGNLVGAATAYFMEREDAAGHDNDDDAQEAGRSERNAPAPLSSGRALGGGPPASTGPTPSTTPAASSSRSGARITGKKIATLGDLNKDQGHSHGHGDDDDDGEGQDLFAGGEKSGLAVQNPGDPRRQVRDILEKARKSGEHSPSAPTSRFGGTGQTLGGDDVPSRVIPDTNPSNSKPTAKVTRILHFWQNGFSVEDGPLYRFDDPASAPILSLIRSGRAPLDIMGVEPGQPVDVTVQPHDEDYAPPKRKYQPFSGGGQRLGSPTPGVSSGSSSQTPPAPATAPSASSTGNQTTVDINESQPTVSLQIRLGNGTRLVSRFNTTHTIGDVYAFVNAADAASASRPWVLMTTFPSKELTDKGTVLGDLSEFKRGGVVVQKWQ